MHDAFWLKVDSIDYAEAAPIAYEEGTYFLRD